MNLLQAILSFPLVYAQTAATTTTQQTEEGLSQYFQTVQDKLPQIIVAVVIFIVSFILARIVKGAAQRAIIKTGRHEGALGIVGKSAYIGTLVLGLMISLKIVNIDISFIVGAIGFGLGFAMKDILQNYISGIIILTQEPFRVGDVVKVGETIGRVEEIQARTTIIRIFDGQRVVIPNTDMISQQLVDFTTYAERRISLELGVNYDTDLPKAIQVTLETLKNLSGILKDPEPQVTFSGFGDSEISMVARFWIDNTVSSWLVSTSQAVQAVKAAWEEAGIGMAYPVTTLSMNKDDSDDLYTTLASIAKLKPEEGK